MLLGLHEQAQHALDKLLLKRWEHHLPLSRMLWHRLMHLCQRGLERLAHQFMLRLLLLPFLHKLFMA